MITMFTGLRAWFSNSVSKSKRKKWQDGGGLVSDLDQAEFVFSEDASHSDTQRIFNSTAYLDEHLSLFHASYITQCLKVGDVKKVALGRYILPPKDVQDIARKQLFFQWDVDGNISDGTNEESDVEGTFADETRGRQKDVCNPASKQTETTSADCAARQKPSTSQTSPVTQKPSTSTTQVKQTPGASANWTTKLKPSTSVAAKPLTEQSQCARKGRQSPKKSDGTVLHVHPKKNTVSSVSLTAGGKCSSGTVQSSDDQNRQNRVENAETTELLRLEDLTKVTGVLEDFTVGKNGCEVSKKRRIVV